MNIAIIPARGGSKRIPRKNVRNFAGKPMVAYAISAARRSGLFEHIVVSTEDHEIASVSRHEGAETPFMRPAALSDDHTPTVPVVAHAIRACGALGWRINSICCIYPAVPLLQSSDLIAAFELLKTSDTDYSFPVTTFSSPIQKALKRSGDGQMLPFYPENELVRTQDLEPAYHDAGLFYWGSQDAWLSNPRIHSSGAGYLMPQWRVVDIDTEEDWVRAELLFNANQWITRDE